MNLNMKTICDICGKNRGDKKFSHDKCSKKRQSGLPIKEEKKRGDIQQRVVDHLTTID